MRCDVLMAETLGDILGATPLGTGECHFLVWAPHADSIKLRILNPTCDSIPMEPLPRGYFRLVIKGPASRFQPDGVHGPSELRPRDAFNWTDALWRGLPIREIVFYEVHVGTFTPE